MVAVQGVAITSNAGALLLGATDGVIQLVGRRVFGIALRQYNLVDHDDRRRDAALSAVLGLIEPRRPGLASLAGKITLNRLQHAPGAYDRYRRNGHDPVGIEALAVELFLDARKTPPARITLDLDTTDDPVHGLRQRVQRPVPGDLDSSLLPPPRQAVAFVKAKGKKG